MTLIVLFGLLASLVLAPAHSTASLASEVTRTEDSSSCGVDTCVADANGDSFHNIIQHFEVSCIAFFSYEEHPEWQKIAPIFEEAAQQLSGDSGIGFAAQSINLNPKLAQNLAVTGPVSIKLFSKRMRYPKSHILYARHNIASLNFTASDLVQQVEGFMRNMSGVPVMDSLVGPFVEALIVNNTETLDAMISDAAKMVSELTSEDEVRAANFYVLIMKGARMYGAVYISHALNNLEKFVSDEAAADEEPDKLFYIASFLSKKYILTQFANELFDDKEKGGNLLGSQEVPWSYRQAQQQGSAQKKRASRASVLG